ncbi:MAG: PLP-dependent aminotransferase family protein [Geminicoccaceae bacterium]
MTIQPSDLQDRPGPTYLALAEVLTDAIADGRLAAGQRLPPQRDLAYRMKVTVGTVGRAYELLAQRGLARGEVGRGTYVLARDTAPAVGPGDAPGLGGLIDLTANFPAPVPAQAALGDLLPMQESAVEVLRDLLRYPDSGGALRHRLAAAEWLDHLGLAVRPEGVLLGNGVQGTLAAALSALARPGDTILTEQLCYSGVRSLVGRLGQHLEPVATDEDGMLPEALAAAARQRGAKILIISPTIQNPSTTFTPAARREALAEVARSLDLLLIEDEVYGPMVPDRPPAMATLVPERTLFLSSVSKFLAPGLRLGFLAAPPDLVRTVTAAQRELCLGLPPFSGELFARALRAGVVAESLRQQRLEMMERQELAAAVLAGLEVRSQPTALHVWLRLSQPWTAAEAALALARAGVLVTPAERFFIGRGAVPQAIRISLSSPATRAHLRDALGRVAAVLAAGTEAGGLVP